MCCCPFPSSVFDDTRQITASDFLHEGTGTRTTSMDIYVEAISDNGEHEAVATATVCMVCTDKTSTP